MAVVAAACMVYISMTCNGVGIGTNSSYWGSGDQFAWTQEQRTLVTHMFNRIFLGKGTVVPPGTPLYSCSNISVNLTCGNMVTSIFRDSWPVDATEDLLINQIWGDAWGAPNAIVPKIPETVQTIDAEGHGRRTGH